MTAYRFSLTALALATLTLPAVAIDPKQHGTAAQCVAGTCTSGEGTIRTQDGTEHTGLWTNGRYTEGRTYKIRSRIQPDRVTEMQVSGEGMPIQGTVLRGDPNNGQGTVGEFSGTFSQVWNPFINRNVSSYHIGKYSDKTGRSYEGEFSYIPARIGGTIAGYFIFQGARIDDENDEVIRGLFVSEQAFPGHAILFRKARPDYLIKLKRDFEVSQVQAVTDARAAVQAAEDDRRSSESMGALLGVMGGLLAISGGGGSGRLGSLQSSSLSALTGGLTGKQSSGDILQGVLSQVMQQAGSDSSLSKSLGGASSAAGLISSLTGLSKSNQPMSRAQYAAQMVSAMAGGGTAGSATPASTGSSAVDTFGTAMINRTTNIIASAITGSSDTGGLGDLGGALLKQAMTSTAAAVATPAAAIAKQPASKVTDHPGTVQLQYTPGKGFLDPVTGRYIKSMEEMSCDNITTQGQKLRDLPPDQRTCVEAGKGSASTVPLAPGVPSPSSSRTKAPENKASAAKVKTSAAAGAGLDPALSSRLGNVAQLTKIDAPDGLRFRGGLLYATNDGVYAAMSGADGNAVAAKRTLGRGSVSGWLTSRLPKGSASFSVSSLAPEGPDEFSIKWVTYLDRYGYINMNNNGGADNYKNDGQVHAFVPMGAKTKSSFYWAVSDDFRVHLESFGGGGAPNFTGRYKPISDGPLDIFKDLAVTDEEGSTLFVANGSRKGIVKIGASKSITQIDLSALGDGFVNTLIAAHGRLWIGYGNQVVTLADGKITPFATLQGIFPTSGPLFCLAGPSMYTADGQVMEGINITASTPRSFIQNSPNIRPEDMKTMIEIKTALNRGLYCADSGAYGPVLYAMGTDIGSIEQKLFIIRPK